MPNLCNPRLFSIYVSILRIIQSRLGTIRSESQRHLTWKPRTQRSSSHRGMVSKPAFLRPRHSSRVDVLS
jgi:hypothetical protein